MRIAVVTGNPKPASRTHGVALAVAGALSAALRPAGTAAAPGPSRARSEPRRSEPRGSGAARVRSRARGGQSAGGGDSRSCSTGFTPAVPFLRRHSRPPKYHRAARARP